MKTSNYPRITITLVLFVIVLLLPSLTNASQANEHGKLQQTAQNPLIRILRSDDSGLTFELNTPPLIVSDDGSIQVVGLEKTFVDAGTPSLPFFSTFIALPPGAEVSAAVKESNFTSISPLYVLPATQNRLQGDYTGDSDLLIYKAGTVHEHSAIRVENPLIYHSYADFPGLASSISTPMYWRDMRLVELKLFPLQYNPYHKSVTQATKLLVDVVFSGSNIDKARSRPPYDSELAVAQRKSIINFDQGQAWRHFPNSGSTLDIVGLPVGMQTFKIEVDEDGIYEVSGSDLAALGLNLPINPAKIQMMQGGKSVAYDFIDANSNQTFDAVDKIRFYGWGFNGSRQEKLYVSNNVYWLWAGGSASRIPIINNFAGEGAIKTSFRESITKWQERHYSSGYAITWDANEATAWHTRRLTLDPSGTEHVENVDLFNPVAGADDVRYLVEITTQFYQPKTTAFKVQTYLNNSVQFGEQSWEGPKNLNVVNEINGNVLKQPGAAGYPANQVKVKFSSSSPAPIPILITRITVDYTRELKAIGDQLIFENEEAGKYTYQVSGFTTGDPGQALVWDISDPHVPKQINMQAQHIVGGGDKYTYRIGREHGPNSAFIATTTDNIMGVKSLSTYKPVAIHPASAGARWLAITHSSLREAADDLAAYRQPQMGAFVVNIEDIVNQIGYGFHTPETIRAYLRSAMNEWAVSPEYVTLFGDATINPRYLECSDCNKWQKDTPNLIATDFKFVDRWQGMIPSDFAMSLLFGDDLIPDIAISRMPANTNVEASRMVEKVINYETQRVEPLQDWQKNFLFIADDADEGGDFCAENHNTAMLMPATYNQNHLCLDTPSNAEISNLRSNMRTQISDVGLSVMNYRGHGSASRWAGYNNEPPILSIDDVDFWENFGRSVVILSADCLDGYFVLNYESGLGETFIRLNNRGSVAHWSSAGLGYSGEHSVLHKGFYEGMFKFGQIALGDAANFAKIEYYQTGRHPSELYSFILLGDAAMKVVPDERNKAFLPITINP